MKIVVLNFIIFVGMNHVVWFDLSEQIFSKFQSSYNQGFSDVSILSEYSPNLVKDPFWDAISTVENRSMQLKVAWSQYVEKILKQKWCNLSQKKIWGILYYFVPEFRTELARSLKQKLGDYDSKKYVFDSETIEKYCKEYFICEKSSEKYSDSTCESEKQKYDECLLNCKSDCEDRSCKSNCESKCVDERLDYGECLNERKWSNIMAASPADMMTNCKEFFQWNYKLGQENQEILQDVEFSQVWAEKYWNNSIEDSPYDIMVDLVALSKLLYQDVQNPTTPVLYKTSVSYKMPNFSSKWGSSSSNNNGGSSFSNNNGGSSSSLNGNKNTSIWWGVEWNYRWNLWDDELVGDLTMLGLKSKDSKIFFNSCEKDDEYVEPDETPLLEDDLWLLEDDEDDEEVIIKFSELSEQEYQEIVDSMLDAVDQYMTIPDELEDIIKEGSTSRNNSIINSTTASELEETAKKIKNCYTSCEWLRVDQKASCMLKCSCWEIKSPIFDPNKTPWLGPIFVIRFCGVPATNTNFSIGWRRISSIEEWLYEIFGVLDKLSREWKLWTWTQQNEFLDSSTKKMNIAKTFAFSISVEFVDIGNKRKKDSDQHKEKEMEDINEAVMRNYLIANGLNDISSKNIYSIIWGWWTVSTLWENKSLAVKDGFESEDLVGDADADRYAEFEAYIGEWMDQQWDLRNDTLEMVSKFDEQAKALNTKKCGN